MFVSHWAYGLFPKLWQHFNIVLLEAYPIVLMLHIFSHHISNYKVIFHTDNETLVTILNKQSTKHLDTMVIIRQIVLTALKYNIIFKSIHVPSIHNLLANPLSHLHVATFRSRAKNMDTEPTQVLHHLCLDHFPLT